MFGASGTLKAELFCIILLEMPVPLDQLPFIIQYVGNYKYWYLEMIGAHFVYIILFGFNEFLW
jgi:hypothetical protein